MANLITDIERLFSELTRHVADADCAWQKITAEDAPEFGVVELFSPNENRLSRIIAELLMPNGSHGQGKLFLELFLKRLEDTRIIPDNQTIGVECESRTYTIANDRRRIDILIDGGSWGIGIENKPWAEEQYLQLEDYTKHLANRFGEHFLLLHLAGNERDITSLSPEACTALMAKGNLETWHYHTDLTKWLKDCVSAAGRNE